MPVMGRGKAVEKTWGEQREGSRVEEVFRGDVSLRYVGERGKLKGGSRG